MAATWLRRLGCLVALVVLVAGILAVPTPAFACSCASAATDHTSQQRAAVVFSGDLVANQVSRVGSTRTLTYRVHRVYKGSAFAEQQVVTQASSASCGLDVDGSQSGSYLVFAQQRPNDKLTAQLCGGTRLGSAPAVFGPGVAPRPAPNSNNTGWVAAGAGLVLGAAALLVLRRRRRHGSPAATESATSTPPH